MEHEFKTRLRQARDNAGLTQRQLAIRADLTGEAIYLYEAGRRTPSVAVAARLAEALGVSVNDLIDPDPVAAAIRCIVDGAPPLTDEQIDELRRALAVA